MRADGTNSSSPTSTGRPTAVATGASCHSNTQSHQVMKLRIPKEPFKVPVEENIWPAELPPLVKQILDAVPVQIFVKKADFEDGNGRRYYYMNEEARLSLGWNEEEVASKYDSEAIKGGFLSPEYKKMERQESDTITNKEPRETVVEWTANTEGSDADWNWSRTIEVPIADAGNDIIAFCAIAQSLEVRSLPEIQRHTRLAFNHEQRNAYTIYRDHMSSVNMFLRDVQRTIMDEAIKTGAIAAIKRLTLAKYQMGVGLVASETVANAFSSFIKGKEDTVEKKTIKNVYDDLFNLYKMTKEEEENLGNKYIHVGFEPLSEELASTTIMHPKILVGILIELIRNALKYSAREFEDEHQIGVYRAAYVKVCCGDEGRIVWKVENYDNKISKGKIEVMSFKEASYLDSRSDGHGTKIGSRLISILLIMAFGENNAKTMLNMERIESKEKVEVSLFWHGKSAGGIND